jgi:hypothetical protein
LFFFLSIGRVEGRAAATHCNVLERAENRGLKWS